MYVIIPEWKETKSYTHSTHSHYFPARWTFKLEDLVDLAKKFDSPRWPSLTTAICMAIEFTVGKKSRN